MVKIQIDLSADEDKIVELFKLMNDLPTKQEAIKQMVKHFEVDVKPKHIKDRDYYTK